MSSLLELDRNVESQYLVNDSLSVDLNFSGSMLLTDIRVWYPVGLLVPSVGAFAKERNAAAALMAPFVLSNDIVPELTDRFQCICIYSCYKTTLVYLSEIGFQTDCELLKFTSNLLNHLLPVSNLWLRACKTSELL